MKTKKKREENLNNANIFPGRAMFEMGIFINNTF